MCYNLSCNGSAYPAPHGRGSRRRGHHVEPKPRKLPNLKLGDHNDLIVVGSALKSGAEILVTGDQEILDLKDKPQGLRILSPREFWTLAAGKE